jgi:tRNA modification GTPase
MGDLTDIICALSSAPGRAGLAVVRVSGPGSPALAEKVFRPGHGSFPLTPRTAVLGSFHDLGKETELDQVVATYFRAPHSYTGDDIIEFSLHGSPVLVAAMLDRLCRAGARIAHPGEFTLRAFLNGKMDLTEAEAVRDVIEATTLFQAQVAGRQRSGSVSAQLKPIKKRLIDIVVQLETAVEFVEEDISLESREEVAGSLDRLRFELREWVDSFRRGRIIRDGFNLAIAGKPNVGKSLLFNSLLAQDRSIVTEVPGTTRDLVSEYVSIEGIPVRLVDTAGVRESVDHVELLGMDRSLQAIADSDAILFVVDGSCAKAEEDDALREKLASNRCILVMNKLDLPQVWPDAEVTGWSSPWPVCRVSARTGEGIDALRKAIIGHLFGERGVPGEGILITNLRQYQCLEAGLESLERAARALRDGLSEEFVLVDLHGTLRQIGNLTGEVGSEEILGEIFSRFCIGK